MDELERAVWDSVFTVRIPPTEELRALTRRLFARVESREGVFRLQRQQFDGAKIHECLDNAIAWVKGHPGDALVYGFSYFDFGYASDTCVSHLTVPC